MSVMAYFLVQKLKAGEPVTLTDPTGSFAEQYRPMRKQTSRAPLRRLS